MEDICCPSDYLIDGSICKCPESLVVVDSACACPENAQLQESMCVCPENSEIMDLACVCNEGYTPGTAGDLLVCGLIPVIPTRENILVSQAGLEIECSVTGASVTVEASEFSSHNRIADAAFV